MQHKHANRYVYMQRIQCRIEFNAAYATIHIKKTNKRASNICDHNVNRYFEFTAAPFD